jgi:S-adenosylmethionine:tRNA ribosyltransferase-isomerase
MDPKNISISGFDYHLPENKIAKYPLAERDASKLLVYKKGEISSGIFKNIADHLPNDSLIIFNNTKVIEARIKFLKETGGVIEIFCLEPDARYADITSAMHQTRSVFWKCLVGGASKWKHGQILQKEIIKDDQSIILSASFVEKLSDCFIIQFSWSPENLSFAEIIHHFGITPLPPYIKREVERSDNERYQTIYAAHDGSVAAPTAGLHFTDHVFKKLAEKNIIKEFVTLHVGAGTFKPVKTETLSDHEMHAEFIEVDQTTITAIINNLERNIIAVGTTSLRTVESLYGLGLKTILFPEIDMEDLTIFQWDAYELSSENISAKESLRSLLKWMKENDLTKIITKTQLLIAPSYQFKIVKMLITNFHQPRSTLLLLIAAFVGDDWKKIYDYALQNDLRFLSYGDSCLLSGYNS